MKYYTWTERLMVMGAASLMALTLTAIALRTIILWRTF